MANTPTAPTLRELLINTFGYAPGIGNSGVERIEDELLAPLQAEIAQLREKVAKGKVLARSVNDALVALPDAEYAVATTLAVALTDYYADHDAASDGRVRVPLSGVRRGAFVPVGDGEDDDEVNNEVESNAPGFPYGSIGVSQLVRNMKAVQDVLAMSDEDVREAGRKGQALGDDTPPAVADAGETGEDDVFDFTIIGTLEDDRKEMESDNSFKGMLYRLAYMEARDSINREEVAALRRDVDDGRARIRGLESKVSQQGHVISDMFLGRAKAQEYAAKTRENLNSMAKAIFPRIAALEAQPAPVVTNLSDAAVRAALNTWNSTESTGYTDAQMAQMRRTMESVLRVAGEEA